MHDYQEPPLSRRNVLFYRGRRYFCRMRISFCPLGLGSARKKFKLGLSELKLFKEVLKNARDLPSPQVQKMMRPVNKDRKTEIKHFIYGRNHIYKKETAKREEEWGACVKNRNHTHRKQIVIEQLRHANDHIKGNWLENVHHLHVFTYNTQQIQYM